MPTKPLPNVLSGQRCEFDDPDAGRLSYYVDGPEPLPETKAEQTARPVLLIHSINASASAHEIQPIYDRLKQRGPVYAIDLPGFGHSERSDRDYTQTLMVSAISAMIRRINKETDHQSVDALAVSLSCEYLGKAALIHDCRIRSIAMVSPTGFARNTAIRGSAEDSLGRPAVLKILKRSWLGPPLFSLLSSGPSIRFFLRKTWGGKAIDEGMFRNACLMARHPEAFRAPLYFLSGFLFSANIPEVYGQIKQPVWLSHGERGDFVDFSRADQYRHRENWTITPYDAGALPYFEHPESFMQNYRGFLADID